MVKIALNISCNLVNLDALSTCGPDFVWDLKIQCRNCNEVDGTWHGITEEETVENTHGPGSSNFQMKCSFCSSVLRIDIIKDSAKVLKAKDGKINKQVAVVFDCRGCEPVAFSPRGGWVCKSEETGTTFSEVDFTEDEETWVDYDEKGQCSVSIEDLKWEFVRA